MSALSSDGLDSLVSFVSRFNQNNMIVEVIDGLVYDRRLGFPVTS